MEFHVEEGGDLSAVAEYISHVSAQKPIVLFSGELGAGKTTLIKEIGSKLGLQGQMNSPTFGIINEYENQEKIWYHIDLYRLEKPEEAVDIGLMEILSSGNTCWVEWPEILSKVWQSYDVASVDIQLNKDRSRRIFVS